MKTWWETVSAAEACGDWDAAISAVSGVAECFSADPDRHGAHLWHLDLLVHAGHLDELAARGESDPHAARRLNRFLYEQGSDADLRQRALHGSKSALYLLVRLLRERGEDEAARQAATEIDATDTYALELAGMAA
ncbi:hypothetical protein ACWIGI_31575 [Nocardia sp. NPDC055321]